MTNKPLRAFYFEIFRHTHTHLNPIPLAKSTFDFIDDKVFTFEQSRPYSMKDGVLGLCHKLVAQWIRLNLFRRPVPDLLEDQIEDPRETHGTPSTRTRYNHACTRMHTHAENILGKGWEPKQIYM